MRTPRWLAALPVAALLSAGCVTVDRPLVEVRQEPEPVDSRRIPVTRTHEEARGELTRAYSRIQQLERDNAALQRDRERYKRERDECRDRLKRYEDD